MERITKVKDIYLDKIILSVREGAFHVERQLRHPKLPAFFWRRGRTMNVAEYSSLDIGVILSATMSVMTK